MSEQNKLTPGGTSENTDDRPVFFLLSGPPGAGKTTSGISVAPHEITEILDFDKVRLSETKRYLEKYPNTTLELADADARYSANVTINNKISDSLSNKTSFAMEGMIWDDKSWAGTQKFQDMGFRFDLAYLGVETADLAAQRVEKRIETGGHTYVTGDLAKTIFSSNLKALNQNFRQPDRLDIYDNTNLQKEFIVSLEKGAVKKVREGPLPDWVKTHLPEVTTKIDQYRTQNQNRSQDQPGQKSEPKVQKNNDQKTDQNIWKQNKNPEQKPKGFKL